MFWFIGFLAFLGYRVFNAGMKSEELFYITMQKYDYSSSKKVMVRAFDGEKLFGYILVSLGFALTWPISLPCVGIYLLGKRYSK